MITTDTAARDTNPTADTRTGVRTGWTLAVRKPRGRSLSRIMLPTDIILTWEQARELAQTILRVNADTPLDMYLVGYDAETINSDATGRTLRIHDTGSLEKLGVSPLNAFEVAKKRLELTERAMNDRRAEWEAIESTNPASSLYHRCYLGASAEYRHAKNHLGTLHSNAYAATVKRTEAAKRADARSAAETESLTLF